MSDTQASLIHVRTNLPEWLLAFTGFVYGTGFLIVYTFFNRFGLKETASDFFKIKYIHVGVLFLIFPMLLIIPIVAMLLRMRMQRQKMEEGERKMHLPVFFLVSNFLLVFYIIIMFAPPDFLRTTLRVPLSISDDKFTAIMLIFGLTILGLVSITRIAEKVIKDNISERFVIWAQWVLLILVLYLDWQLLFGLYRRLVDMLVTGQYFIYLLILISLTAWFTYWRLATVKDRTRKRVAGIVAGCIMGALYYMSVLAFSFGIYPYISAEKGGGDYSDASNVIVEFSPQIRDSLPASLLDNASSGARSKSLILIQETGTSYFVADPGDAGGPLSWRRYTRPNVFEIRRDIVIGLTYINH
jgi:hypothetical protein